MNVDDGDNLIAVVRVPAEEESEEETVAVVEGEIVEGAVADDPDQQTTETDVDPSDDQNGDESSND
jgi:DNA gyrase subunit A